MPFPEMEQVRLPGERSRCLPVEGRSHGLPQGSSPQGRSQGRRRAAGGAIWPGGGAIWPGGGAV